jgi:Tfp pilus assembly protein PilN
MIEINLLPEELRKADGTPPARLLVIFLSVGLMCAIGFLIVNYHFVMIPGKNTERATLDADIKNLQAQEKEVQEKKSEIEQIEKKVKSLQDLEDSRVRYGELLDIIWEAVPENGVWFKSFKVALDSSAPVVPGTTGGKAYQIELLGYAAGQSDPEMNDRLVELIKNLRQKLEIKEKPAAGMTVAPDYGVNNRLKNVRFLMIDVPDRRVVDSLPQPEGIDAEAKDAVRSPPQALDFTMTIKFQMYQPQAN